MALVYQEWILVHTLPRVTQWKRLYSPGAQLGACWWPGSGVGWGGGVGGSRWGRDTRVHIWLVHDVVQRNQHSTVKQLYSVKNKMDIGFCPMVCLYYWDVYIIFSLLCQYGKLYWFIFMLNQFCIPRINPTYP